MLKIEHPKKPPELQYISDTCRSALSLKQKDCLIFIYVKRYQKAEIMRRLYLTNRSSYNNFRYNLRLKLKKYNH